MIQSDMGINNWQKVLSDLWRCSVFLPWENREEEEEEEEGEEGEGLWSAVLMLGCSCSQGVLLRIKWDKAIKRMGGGVMHAAARARWNTEYED